VLMRVYRNYGRGYKHQKVKQALALSSTEPYNGIT
jgi:hypothetical protein